jgi:hypothetical protein
MISSSRIFYVTCYLCSLWSSYFPWHFALANPPTLLFFNDVTLNFASHKQSKQILKPQWSRNCNVKFCQRESLVSG